ncbi:MAG: non-canonical purine NTP pyrophosphatase [Candidatus Dojkabacteria bacterium]|nr:MAG: non-canonical purine NTP pyrophosphatase [Candidatus Dojkabacteria bacterium]
MEQAFEVAKSAVVVTDTGWNIHALKGFPGPFMHYVTDWFSPQDFLNLMSDKADRSITFMDVLAYKDGDKMKIFKTIKEGTILTEPAGEGIPIDQIVTFRADGKSIALCNSEEISSFDETEDISVWTKFGKWFNEQHPN